MGIAPDVPYNIGDFAFGGYVAGVIDTTKGNIVASDASQTGKRYVLIVAPASSQGSYAFRSAAGSGPTAANTRWDGLTATAAMASTTYPAANYCYGLAVPSDKGSKWYLPAMDELELIYRNLKPTTESNNTSGNWTTGAGTFPLNGGAHSNAPNTSSDPAGGTYTSTSPGQTGATAFRSGGAQTLGIAGTSTYFWSATQYGSGLGWVQSQSGSSAGDQTTNTNTVANRVRAARRVLVSDLNTAPNAPTLTTPANNATIDRGIVQRFTWTFSDPDAGDSQSAYEIRYQRTN